MSIDSFDDFDIDKDNSTEPTKKVLRNRNIKKTESSGDEESEQSLMSPFNSDNDTNAPPVSALQRFKNKVRSKNSEHSDGGSSDDNIGKKRRRKEYDSDESDDDYSEFNECVDDEPSTAWKGTNNSYDGHGLKLFYRDTLGIETETESDSDSESEPMKKKRKLNDNNNLNRNKLTSKLAENQLKESFGTLPVSADIICKICKYLTLTQISSTLVLINHEFCDYLNTDKYWQKFYFSLSKNIITMPETKIIKKYNLKTSGDNKIYKRRVLWYYTVAMDEPSIFNQLLMEYIPPLLINEFGAEEYNKDKYRVDRLFAIRLYLVKQCVVMHFNKKHANNYEKTKHKYGIDQVFRYCNDEMKVIMPGIKYSPFARYQYEAIWSDNKYKKMDNVQGHKFLNLCNKFNVKWKSQNDIFGVFRYINQLYIEYILNGMVKENVKDLQYLVSLQTFYETTTGNATKVIKNLCDDESTIHNIIDIGDGGDTMQVTIQSPKIILHQQIKYIMHFINNYDDNGNLCCKLITLMDEMKERKIISSLEEFENLKALIDRNQFKLNKDCITCILFNI